AAGRVTLEEAIEHLAIPKDQADAVCAGMLRALQGPFFELYSLQDDPLEAHDLASLRPARVAQLREALESQRQRAHAPRRAPDARPPYSASAEELEELRQLGYVGGH